MKAAQASLAVALALVASLSTHQPLQAQPPLVTIDDSTDTLQVTATGFLIQTPQFIIIGETIQLTAEGVTSIPPQRTATSSTQVIGLFEDQQKTILSDV